MMHPNQMNPQNPNYRMPPPQGPHGQMGPMMDRRFPPDHPNNMHRPPGPYHGPPPHGHMPMNPNMPPHMNQGPPQNMRGPNGPPPMGDPRNMQNPNQHGPFPGMRPPPPFQGPPKMGMNQPHHPHGPNGPPYYPNQGPLPQGMNPNMMHGNNMRPMPNQGNPPLREDQRNNVNDEQKKVDTLQKNIEMNNAKRKEREGEEKNSSLFGKSRDDGNALEFDPVDPMDKGNPGKYNIAKSESNSIIDGRQDSYYGELEFRNQNTNEMIRQSIMDNNSIGVIENINNQAFERVSIEKKLDEVNNNPLPAGNLLFKKNATQDVNNEEIDIQTQST